MIWFSPLLSVVMTSVHLVRLLLQSCRLCNMCKKTLMKYAQPDGNQGRRPWSQIPSLARNSLPLFKFTRIPVCFNLLSFMEAVEIFVTMKRDFWATLGSWVLGMTLLNWMDVSFVYVKIMFPFDGILFYCGSWFSMGGWWTGHSQRKMKLL